MNVGNMSRAGAVLDDLERGDEPATGCTEHPRRHNRRSAGGVLRHKYPRFVGGQFNTADNLTPQTI